MSLHRYRLPLTTGIYHSVKHIFLPKITSFLLNTTKLRPACLQNRPDLNTLGLMIYIKLQMITNSLTSDRRLFALLKLRQEVQTEPFKIKLFHS